MVCQFVWLDAKYPSDALPNDVISNFVEAAVVMELVMAPSHGMADCMSVVGEAQADHYNSSGDF